MIYSAARKAKERTKLNDDIQDFLARGGKIKKLHVSESAEKNTKLSKTAKFRLGCK